MELIATAAADLPNIGLPLIGRLLALFLCGCSAVLGASYYVLHAPRDPKWLVTIATLALILLLYTAAIMMELTWQSQMLPLDVYRSRQMWEYVAIQPARTFLPAVAQGYLIKRYDGLSRGEKNHRLAALTFTSALVTEQALYLCVIILEVWQLATPAADRLGAASLCREGLRRRVYTSVFFIAACLDSSLAIGFCLRMRDLRGKELSKGIDESLRFVMGVALATGFSTTFLTISTAIWFRAKHNESFRLLVNFGPPMYAASLYLALLSRERIRTRIDRSQSERLEAAVANLEHIPDSGGNDDEVSLRAMFALGPPEASRDGERRRTGCTDASTSASYSDGGDPGADLCVCRERRESAAKGAALSRALDDGSIRVQGADSHLGTCDAESGSRGDDIAQGEMTGPPQDSTGFNPAAVQGLCISAVDMTG